MDIKFTVHKDSVLPLIGFLLIPDCTSGIPLLFILVISWLRWRKIAFLINMTRFPFKSV